MLPVLCLKFRKFELSFQIYGKMIKRYLSSSILEALNFYPAVGLIGPRQVGKTTLAKALIGERNHSIRYFDLERLEDYTRLVDDPGFFLEQFQGECVILDEIQRMSALFVELRSLIDRNRTPGRFLLLGSASPLLLQAASETLAGRIAYLSLHPLHYLELSPADGLLQKHWWRGGFPEAWLAPTDEWSIDWREQFIRTYVERDLQVLGLNTDTLRFRNFLQMLAATHGNLWNAESVARSLGVSSNTVRRYLHFLESSFFVQILPPFFTNISKRLVKSPKIYIRDTGLLHALLSIRYPDALPISPYVGASWEGYAISQITSQLPKGVDPYFYRTADGTECDLVLVKGLTPILTVEIKYSNTVKLSAGYYHAIESIRAPQNFVLTFSSESYQLNKQVQVMSLPDFLGQLGQLTQPDVV